MGSEWTTVALGEVIIDFDSRRKPVKGSERRSGPYPYYGASGVVDHVDAFLFEGRHLLIAEDGENLKTRQTPIAFLADGKYWVNNHAHVVRANSRGITEFLCYALAQVSIQPYLTGSTMPKLTQGNMRRIQIPLPPVEEQKRIVSILGALDDKIAQLRETNATLEAIAQALFKSWFVDFDPVRAKAEGRDPVGVPPEVADLFPSEFEDSELGAIPKGWKILRVGDLLELAYGKALKATDRTAGDIPVYGSGGITGSHNRALVQDPTVIVGRKGTVGSLYWEDRPSYPIDTVFFVKPRLASLLFCHHLLLNFPLTEMNTDAAVPGLNRENVYRLKFPMPTMSLLHEFDATVGSLRVRMSSINDEVESLTAIRDTLLPRLMSGKLRIQDVTA
jgi:type I restriction enzyme S subunit